MAGIICIVSLECINVVVHCIYIIISLFSVIGPYLVAAGHCLTRKVRDSDHPALESLPAYRRLGFDPEERKSLEDEMNTSIGMMGPLLQG